MAPELGSPSTAPATDGRLLFVLGGGGHAAVVCDIAAAVGRGNLQVCDPALTTTQTANGWPVSQLGERELIERYGKQADFVVAIGDAERRRNAIAMLDAAGATLATLVHPSAVISPHAAICDGTVVMAGVIVNANACVGRAAILNSGSIVEHDCALGDGVHMSPGAVLGGGVEIGEWAWIGAGAVVLPLRKIGDGAIVGAGAVVIRDVPARTTVVGNPARRLDRGNE